MSARFREAVPPPPENYQYIYQGAKNATRKVGNCVHRIGMPLGNKRLVKFITQAV